MANESLRATSKVTFVNLDTLEERAMQFNPVGVETGVTAEYTRFTAVGLSYQPMQFSHTTNRTFSITLQFKVERPAERQEVDQTLDFLRSLMHPREEGAAPPDVTFVWPNTTYVPVKVLGVTERWVQFNAEGFPTRIELDVTMERVRSKSLLQDEVYERGIRE